VLFDKSATGTCFYIGDVSAAGGGTFYMKDSACGAATDPGAAAVTNPHASSADATWSLAF
jgi:hypothetical protein